MPAIEVFDHSEIAHGHDLAVLQRLAERALPEVLHLATPQSVFADLSEIEVTLVDDATIARLHDEYMGLPNPTDVITFQHGEIVISVETAARQATAYGRTPFEEVVLYLIHGLLHLAGQGDKSDEDFQQMRRTQEAVFQKITRDSDLRTR